MFIFQVQSTVSLIVAVVLLAVKLFAFVNSLLWSAESYEAAGKLTKPTWTILLGIGVVLQLVPIIFILSLVFTIVALVYLADVRPALAGLRRR